MKKEFLNTVRACVAQNKKYVYFCPLGFYYATDFQATITKDNLVYENL